MPSATPTPVDPRAAAFLKALDAYLDARLLIAHARSIGLTGCAHASGEERARDDLLQALASILPAAAPKRSGYTPTPAKE